MNTEISRYLVDANGNSFSSDTDLQSLSKNAKVKNTNSGVSYKKVQGTTSGVPVFDKVPFQEGQPDAVLYSPQSLTTAQKQQARTNIGASGGDAVLYSPQSLTKAQKQQARDNIGAIDLTTGSMNFVSTEVNQHFLDSTINRILKNIGIQHVTGNSSARKFCSRLAIGNTQLLYGYSGTRQNGNYFTVMFEHPFINDACVLGTAFITRSEDNVTCGVLGNSSSPRTSLFGTGSDFHMSRVFYGAIGQSFPLDENAKLSRSLGIATTRVSFDIQKTMINMTSSMCYFLVDMFISADASSDDYIEFDSMSGITGTAVPTFPVGRTKLSNTTGFDEDGRYTRGFDVDLSENPDGLHNEAKFSGYNDISDRKLFTDPQFRAYKMRSFVVAIPSSDISGDSTQFLKLSFNMSLSNVATGFIRVFYIPSVSPQAGGSSSSGSSSSGGSSSSSSQTWGVTKFNTVNGGVGQSTKSVGQTVSEGKIVRIYALTHWTQTNQSTWDGLSYTDWYYIWKDNNYTLTDVDKSLINGLPTLSDCSYTPSQPPHATLSYNSGNI